jgi:sugar lactone lactonase YvrE
MHQYKNHFCLILSLAAVIIMVTCLSAAAKTRIAVVDLESQGEKAKQQDAGKMAAQLLSTAFVQDGRFDVVERQALQKIIEEQKLGISGLIDATTAAQLGRVVGATYIVTGAVISYPQGMDLVVKILETESGTIKVADSMSGGSSAAIFKKIPSFVTRLTQEFPIEGIVIQKRAKNVILDVGSKAGASKGMKFKVYRDGQPIKHPVTGDILGMEKIDIGFVKITEVQEKLSFARVEKLAKGQKIAVGQRVVSLQTTAPPSYAPAATTSSEILRFERTWGRQGTGTGDFYLPYGMTADSAGNIYIADTYNNRVQVFDASGTYRGSWGQKGIGQGSFVLPYDIAADKHGHVYVADTYNFRIQKFDTNGRFILQWGQKGAGTGQFAFLSGIAVGPEGSVYTTDAKMHRIQVFDRDGRYLRSWGQPGKDNGSFVTPMGLDVDDQGNVYVADSKMRRIQKFGSRGNFLATMTLTNLVYPTDVSVDRQSGNIFVLDGASHYFWELSPTGQNLRSFGGPGRNSAQFVKPYGICTDDAGNVFVADTGNSRIQKFGH